MSTTDILDLVKKVKSEMPAGAFSPVEGKSLVYGQQQDGETVDPSSLTPEARDVLRLVGKIKQGSTGIDSGVAGNLAGSQGNLKYDSREQAIIDRNIASSANDKLAGEAAGDMEVQQRRQQRAYAEQAPPEVAAQVKELLSSSGDRNKVLDIVRNMTPEQREETLRLAPGIAQQLGDDRGGAIGRTLGALSLGVSKGVSQPLMELVGAGGTKEEIEYIRKLDALASQEFAPARPGDPWYEAGPLQAAQMAPWMATVVGAGGLGRAAGQGAGTLLARGAAAGVPGAKAAFQAAGAVGRVPTAIGLKGATTKGVFQGAGTLAGITSAAFPGQYAQEVDQLKEIGMEDDWKLRLLAGGTATVAGLVEGIVPNPFGGTVSLKQGAMKAARQYLWEALKKAPPELGEEYLQGVTSGLGQHVAQYIDKDAKEKTIADAFANGWEQTKEAALPMAFLLGVPAVGGAGLSAIRARRYQLEQIRAKNFVSESDAKAAGIEGNSRRERMANVESEIEQLGQQEAEASKQLDQEFINQQQQGGQAQRLPSSAELQAELDAIRLKTSSTEKVKLADGTAIPGRQARYLTWEERQRYKTLPGLIEEAKQREAAQGDPAIPLQAPQPQVGVQPEQTVAGSQIDEAGELVPQASQADLDREFFERMAARGGNVSTPSGDIVLPSPVTLPSQPVAGQPSVPQQTPASFAARMARGEQMTSPEDQQYRINNAAEIEAELQKLMSPTDTATAPPAEQPPVQPLTDKEFFDQQAGGNVATPEVPPVTPTAGDPFGEAAPPAEDPREQPEEKEASAQSKVSDDTYKKIREVLRPANREDLQLAVPYLRVLYPEYASDLNDPWGIGRAVQQGSELPRVPTADLSRRIRDAISLGVLSEAGDVISQEPSALTPEQQIQSDREFADRKAAAEINGKTVEQMRNEGMSEDEIQEEESKQNYFNVIGDVTKASDKDLNRAYGFSGRLVDYHERKGQSDMAESVRREQESMKAEIKRRNAQEDQQPDQPVPPSDIASAESDMDAAMREEFKKQLGEKDDKQPPKKRPPRKDGKSKKPSSLKKSKGKARKEADNLWDELIKKSQNKLLTGLDPELLTLAARIAIKELEYSAISFAEFVERSVAKVPDTLLEKLKPYLESAWRTAYDSEMTTDAGGKFDDYIKKPEKSRPKTDELQGELRIPVAGQPFTFTALHNKEKSPDMGSRFGQDKEPAGRYVVAISDSNTAAADMPDKFDRRTVTFQNPLVIEFGGGYQEASNWKQVLSGRYGGLTGKALSQAIVDDGFDGIVTVEPAKGTNRPAHTSEIVDLSTIKAEGKPAKPTPAEVVFGEITDGRKPDLQIAAVAANNQYGIWAKIGTRWRFIGNAGANREQAIAKAKERAESIARGETTGVAFIGSELLAVKPKLIQVLENTLDPEQLVSAEKIAIGDQPVGFGKHANKTVKDLIEQEPGYVSWLIENATTPRAKQIVSYLLERPEFAAKIEQENQDVSNLVDEKATKLLAKFGLRANASNGRIYIRGETYEWKDQIRNAGGRWNKGDEAWSLTAEGFEKLQEELRGLPVPDDATGGRLPAYLKDTELRRLREDVDGRPDSRKSSEVVAGLVGQDTKDLISQGLKIGMPQRVVDEQIEDVGSIVDAYKENKGLFLLASEPGSGKTFVLGGAIRELKKAGAKKFTYVTLRTELIGQIKNDLKSYGIDDVEFITYPAMRSGGAKQSDVLIFDEAHSIKNIDESQQAKEAAKWIRKAGFTIFASATPMENPVQAEYLEPTGVFEDLGGFKQFALLFGANIRRIGDQEYIAWERNPLSETDARRSQEYLTKRGLMVSRRIMLPENQVDSRFVKIGVQDSDAARYDALAQAAAENAQQLFGYGRPYIVNLQKRLLEASKVNQAMDEAQAALDRGRFPIIFVETKEKRSIDIPSLIERLDEYNRAVSAAQMMGDEKPQRKDFGLPPAGVVETFAAYMSITGESTIEIPSAESVIRKRFGVGNVAIFTGSVTPAKAQKNLDAWRSGEKPLLVATMAKGGTGLSLHDKVGDHQTTQINVNLPWTATQVVQVTQRSARYGLKGKAEILWLFADNIPFDRMLSARVGGRMADMGASVHGQEIKGASDLLDWNFEERSFAGEYDQDAETSVSPWSGATVEDENRWAGTTVNVSAKGKEESYAGTVVRVLNKGETIEVQREGFDSAIRVPAERVSVIDLVDSKAGSSTEQADRAAKILADMESNQEKMRQDKKRREGEKLADWVKAFEGSPREVTAAKDLFRKDFEKARENGVSDDRLIEIIDHGRANDIFTEKEATDLKSRIKPDSVSSGDIESVPIVTEDQIGGGADGTYDQMHSGLASKLVQQKIALGMKGIDGREYGIFEHSEGKWQLVSRPMVKPEPTPKQRHELLLDRAAPYVEKGESYKRDIADPAVRLQMAIAKGNAIDSSLVQTLTDELEVRLDYWEPILQKAKEENEARDQEDEERPDTGTVGQDRRAISEYGVKGKSASVITADKSTRRATYYAVEADSLIPSHDARKNFAKNEGSLENERPYEDPKEGADSRQTVRGIAEVDKEKRYLLTSDTMSPTDGPPIVDLYGRVLGGNARSMGMQLAYAGPNADVLRSHMRAEGAKFEIPQEQLDALNNPVIIRVMEEPFDENTISSLLNESLAAAKSQATVVVSQSKRLSEETIDLVASILGAETEPSLREVMANPRQSTRIVQAIVRDGAWSDKDIAVYVDPGTGDLTAEGKLAIENMLVARVIPNVSLLGDVAPAVKQKILSAIGPLTKGLASEKFGKQMLGDLVAAIEAYDGYIAERKTNSLQSYFFEQKQMFPVPGHGSVTVAGIVHALADFTPTKFRNAMRDVVESLGIGERTPSLFGDDVTYDTIEDAVRNVINPPLRKDNDLLMQLDDRITDPPQSLFQSDPDIDATIRSKALDLGIAANEAGITAFDDFVRYSLKRNGEKLTRYMGAYLAMVGKTVGMTGIRPVKDILGVPMTPAEYVQLGKEAFAGSPQVTPEQVEAGIEAAMLTGLPQMAVGFAPAGSPVPGRKTREVLTQGDFDQPADYEFTESDYRPAVVSYARDKWGDAMASNGKPTWQNFVRWFGGSEVVDKDGKPLVVYHGTAKTFDKFYQKDDTKSPSKLIGFFFSPSAKMASDHIARRSGGEPGSQIYPTYLSVKNPYVESVMDHMDMNVWSAAKIKKWKQSLIDEGYDGVYIKPSKSMPGYEDGVWVAFEPTQIKSATGNRGTFDPNNPNMLYQEEVSASQSQMEQQSSSRISPELEKELDAGEKVTLYRAMMLIDGKLYPPMSGKVADDSGKVKTRDPETIGKWMRSEERPDLIAKSGRNAGKFKLEKAGGDGSDVWVVYAPYFHASPMPLNDQFSAAWLNDGISRPQLVTVEIEVPKSELTSGYQAQNSPKKVGANKWQSGVVASKIPGGRDVVLSRYARIKRIVPDAEVAKKIAEIVNPARLSVPENTVTPQLRAELEKNGVRISPQGTSGDDVFYQQETQLSVVHNLSAESLVFADKMGGLAVPSLAVVRADMGLEGVSHYGEITLIGTRELADPQIVETYDADAYTPTFPKPEYRTVKRSVAQSLVNQLRPWSEKFASRSAMDAAWDNAVNKANPQDTVYQFLNSNSVKGWFLQEIGIQADPVKSAVKPRWDWAHSKAWVQFVKSADHEASNLRHDDPARKNYMANAKIALEEAMREHAEQFKRAGFSQSEIDSMVEDGLSNFTDRDGDVAIGYLDSAIRSAKEKGSKKVDVEKTRKKLDKLLAGKEQEFKAWAEEKILPMYGEPFITIGKKKVEYNLDNIVEAMTRKGIKATQETWTFGEGKARAAAAQRIRSLEEMRNRSGSMANRSEVLAARDEAKSAIGAWREKVVGFYGDESYGPGRAWDGLDASMRAIAKWANGRSLKDALRSEGFKQVPEEVVSQGVEAGRLFMQSPVPYFEAKPTRVVGLQEFAGAVIPSDAPSSIKSILEKNGVPFKTYSKAAGESSRTSAVAKFRGELMASGKGTLFQTQQQGGKVKGWTKFISGTRALIGATSKADISTVIHEYAHVIRRFLLNRDVPQDQRIDITDEEIAMLEEKCGVKDGNWDVPAEEKFAKMWEQYFFEGKSPNTLLDSLFEKISRWMQQVYQSAMSITGGTLDPEVRDLFDKMVQRQLPADQRTGARSRDGGKDKPPIYLPVTSDQWGGNLTSLANAAANATRERLKLPSLTEPASEGFQEWLDAAVVLMRNDPTYANRLVKELQQSSRSIDDVDVAVLNLHYRHLKNLSDAAANRLFKAIDDKQGDVAIVQARRESDALINEIEDFTDMTKKVGTEAGRALVARKIALAEDYTLGNLLLKARVANAGQPLSEAQLQEVRELADKIAKLEGDLAKEIQEKDDLARKLAAKESIDDTQKQVGKPVRNTATNRAVKKVESFVSKFVNIFGKRDDTTTLQQTEDEAMAEDGEEVIKSFVEAGVYSFGEFMSKFKAVIKGDVPVAARAALRKAWDKLKAQGDIPAPDMSDERQTAELRRLAKMVERNLVEFGITDPEEVIDGVHEALQEVFEDVTRREAMDAMSGYGQYSTPSQEPVDKIIRDLNAQYQQMAKKDDMQQGIAPKKSGRGRDEPSPELRELIREVNEMKRNSKYFITDPEAQLKTIFQATRTALRNRIYDLNKAIKTKEPIPGRTPNTFEGEQAKEIESLRKRRDELMADYKATFPKPGLTFEQRAAIAERAVDREITKIEQQLASGNVAAKERAEPISTPALKDKQNRLESLRAQREAVREMQMTDADREQRAERLERQAEKAYVANLLNRIADYEDRKARGYFGPKPKKEPRTLSPREIELSRQLVSLKDEFFRYAAEYRLKNMGRVERAWDNTKETMNLSRAIMTSFDLSAVFRQGGIASLAHPRLAGAAGREMWDALRNQNAEFDTMDKIENDALYAFAMQCGLPITTDKGKIQRQEEAYAGRMVKYGIGKKGTKLNTWSKWALRPVTASGRAYTTFLNSMRFRLFKYMVSNLGAGGAVTVDEGKVIASYISAATGRADLGKFNQAAANLNTVFFAPRYVASRFQYLAMPFYLLPSTKVSGRVKKMIAMEYARHAMGLTAFLGLSVALASLLTDDEEEKPTVEFDPRSSDFMKLKIGDTRIDPMAGLSQAVTLIGQMATGQKKGLRGDIKDLYGENRKFGDPDLWDVGTGFLRKKLAPIPGAIVDLRVGENVIGEKETVLSATTDLFVPLSFQEAGETMKARGLVGGAVVTALSLLGMGGGTYGTKTQYATADAAKREELFNKDLDRVKWNDPDLAYKDFLTTAQVDKFNKQREGRKQSLVFSAAADPKRKDYNSDETFKKSVEDRDKALDAIVKAGMGPKEIQLLLIAYYKRNYGSAYETREGVYQMKESLASRLRTIRRKLNEKKTPAK